DDVPDRRLLETLLAGAGEGVVEVRPDRPLGACTGERVAGAALLGEELLAVCQVGLAALEAAGSAAGGGEGGSGPQDQGAVVPRPPCESDLHGVPSSSQYENRFPLRCVQESNPAQTRKKRRAASRAS